MPDDREHQKLQPDTLPQPRGYSHGIIAEPGRHLFVAGQIGCDATGSIVSADLVDQFGRALLNIMETIRSAGGRASSIVRMNIYVTDVTEYRARLRALGSAYRGVMGYHYPVMTLVEVKGLFEPRSKIEVEATAVL